MNTADDITFTLNGRTRTVARADYVRAKAAQLREFGYEDLTDENVSEELDKLLAGKPLTIIGKMMQGEVVIE